MAWVFISRGQRTHWAHNAPLDTHTSRIRCGRRTARDKDLIEDHDTPASIRPACGKNTAASRRASIAASREKNKSKWTSQENVQVGLNLFGPWATRCFALSNRLEDILLQSRAAASAPELPCKVRMGRRISTVDN